MPTCFLSFWGFENGDYLAHMGLGFRVCFHKMRHLDFRCRELDQKSLIPVMQIHKLVQMHSAVLVT